MNATIRSLLISAIAVVGLLVAGPAAAACLSQGEARQAVASGQALPLGAVARSAGGQIVNGCLANEGGRLVYRLKVDTGGRVVDRVIDAASGQVLQ